jgi:hypothetical protein
MGRLPSGLPLLEIRIPAEEVIWISFRLKELRQEAAGVPADLPPGEDKALPLRLS